MPSSVLDKRYKERNILCACGLEEGQRNHTEFKQLVQLVAYNEGGWGGAQPGGQAEKGVSKRLQIMLSWGGGFCQKCMSPNDLGYLLG